MRAILNIFSDPRLSECEHVYVGDTVYAHQSGVEHNLTKDMGYKIMEIVHPDMIVIKNDAGKIDEYSVEYFRKRPETAAV